MGAGVGPADGAGVGSDVVGSLVVGAAVVSRSASPPASPLSSGSVFVSEHTAQLPSTESLKKSQKIHGQHSRVSW